MGCRSACVGRRGAGWATEAAVQTASLLAMGGRGVAFQTASLLAMVMTTLRMGMKAEISLKLLLLTICVCTSRPWW